MVVLMPRRSRPRGHTETLPSGHFRAVVDAGIDVLTGQEHRLRETCDTWDQAEVALTRIQGQVDANKHPKSAITIAEAVEQWLEVVKLGETTRTGTKT